MNPPPDQSPGPTAVARAWWLSGGLVSPWLGVALSGLPEWAALSRAQRRIVWSQFVHPLVYRWQTNLAKTCIFLPVLFGAVRLGVFDHDGTTLVSIFILIIALPELFDFLMVLSYRQRVSHFIQHHGSEIQSAA